MDGLQRLVKSAAKFAREYKFEYLGDAHSPLYDAADAAFCRRRQTLIAIRRKSIDTFVNLISFQLIETRASSVETEPLRNCFNAQMLAVNVNKQTTR